MMSGTKKFKKEISALPKLLEQRDFLSSAELEAVKQRVMSRIERAGFEPEPKGWQFKGGLFFRYSAATVLGLGLVGGTAFAASGNSVPGDVLYPVKIAREKVQLTFTKAEDSKIELKAKFAQNRLDELKVLASREGGKESSVSSAENEQQESGQEPEHEPKTAFILAPINVSTLNVPSSSSSTIPFNFKNKKNSISKKNNGSEFENQARAEVISALSDLRKLRNRLKSNGDGIKAQRIEGTILNLKTRAKQEHIKVEDSEAGGLEDSPEPQNHPEQNSGKAEKGSDSDQNKVNPEEIKTEH